MIKSNQKNRAVFFSLYFIFILTIIILADLDKLPLHLLMKFPHYDWIAHFILYGFFYSLLNSLLMYKKVNLFGRRVSISFIISSFLITAEEFSQILFTSRTFSLMDLAMGFLGIFFWKFLKERKRRKKIFKRFSVR